MLSFHITQFEKKLDGDRYEQVIITIITTLQYNKYILILLIKSIIYIYITQLKEKIIVTVYILIVVLIVLLFKFFYC